MSEDLKTAFEQMAETTTRKFSHYTISVDVIAIIIFFVIFSCSNPQEKIATITKFSDIIAYNTFREISLHAITLITVINRKIKYAIIVGRFRYAENIELFNLF